MFARACAAAGVIAGCGTAAIAQQDPAVTPATRATCSLRPAFQVGRVLVYTFRNTTRVMPGIPQRQADGTMSAAPTASVYTTDVTLRLTTIGADENGGALMEFGFDRVKLSSNAGTGSAESEMTREAAEKMETPKEDAAILERLAYSLVRASGTIEVQANGVVSSADGFAAAQAIARTGGLEAGYLLGPFAATSERRTLTMLFRVDTPSDAGVFSERKSGDSWTLIDRVPVESIAEMVLTTSLEMESCGAEEAKLVGAVVTSVEPPREKNGEPSAPDPARPKLAIVEQSDVLRLTWNPKKGVLTRRERESSLGMTAGIGAASRPGRTLKTQSLVELVETVEP